ncbi:LAME_0D01376g1_1 [Lachancea meyersii CBS 8951]|uniref:LAME_0D01376g1_1 n=1 Tax=Lachancea meyersii CBS 8951 TaxID=1266667 RepID=A0A1G4J782_9SACH|nr:LAME_0D01376g1_1 [Lachancea meyersii CBS 8951]
MNYDEELAAPVWDDANESSNVENGAELAQTFANLSTLQEHVDQDEDEQESLVKSAWNQEEEEPLAKQDLLASLAPQEDPLAEIAVPSAGATDGKGETLFGDVHTSPLEVSEQDSEAISATSGARDASSPVRKSVAKPQKLFSSARLRRHPLNEAQKADLFEDPLNSHSTGADDGEVFVEEPLDEEEGKKGSSKKDILQQMDAPLFRISPRKSLSATPLIKKIAGGDSQNVEAPLQPNDIVTETEQFEPPSSDLKIEVVDPLKVGDLTFAHVEYTIWTRSPRLNPQEVRVQRRYRDFRWLYRQLQNNHWGKIIPPPPEKQAVGRFKDDFIESRRLQMERMLTKIAQDKKFQDDVDFMMFLQSQNFSQDSKIREHLTGSNASSDSNDISEIHISPVVLLGHDDAVNVMKNGGLDEAQKSFMNISFGAPPKYTEPDGFFVEQKQGMDVLEEQLKQLSKSLEIVETQSNDLASVTEEFANTIKSLEALEVSRKASDTLANFAEVHMRIRDSLQRSAMQESLTLGVTIDEYTRALASVRAVFNQRSKLGYYLVIVENDMVKKKAQLERSTQKGPSNRVNALTKDLQVLQDRHNKIKAKWQEIGDTIRRELRKHDHEKMVDFRNNMEIFLESSIETQKECIELWETFYQNNL